MKKMILMLSLAVFSGLYGMESSVLEAEITEAKVKMETSKAKLNNIIVLIQQASQKGFPDIESKKNAMALIALRRKEAEQYEKYQEEYESLIAQKTT